MEGADASCPTFLGRLPAASPRKETDLSLGNSRQRYISLTIKAIKRSGEYPSRRSSTMHNIHAIIEPFRASRRHTL